MKVENTVPGGNSPDPSGDLEVPEKKDVVAYDTYQKVLREKKKRDEELDMTRSKLAEYEAKDKEREETEAKAKGDLQKLIAMKEEENKKLKDKYENVVTTLTNAEKRNALLKALPGEVDQNYWGLLDLNQIVLDPETGEADATSIRAAADLFVAKYPLVIKTAGGARLPGHAAKGAGGKLTKAEWEKLPLKEKQERLAEVLASHSKT